MRLLVVCVARCVLVSLVLSWVLWIGNATSWWTWHFSHPRVKKKKCIWWLADQKRAKWTQGHFPFYLKKGQIICLLYWGLGSHIRELQIGGQGENKNVNDFSTEWIHYSATNWQLNWALSLRGTLFVINTQDLASCVPRVREEKVQQETWPTCCCGLEQQSGLNECIVH